MKKLNCVVIGGGAAGFFGAISCAAKNPEAHVFLLEKNRQILAKVRISGGGRCNVTHACFDPQELASHYPRGSKALLGPFYRFQPKDTIEWFEKRGVELKIEDDGRMFPITDSSQTIIDCLLAESRKLKVDLRLEAGIENIQKSGEGFDLILSDGSELYADRLLIATGSHPAAHQWALALGHSIVPPVPSLFTFTIPNFPLQELAGISVECAEASISETSLVQSGPLLITHWGFSGPAILKLSAWGARILHQKAYQGTLSINWLPHLTVEKLRQMLLQWKIDFPRKQISTDNPCGMPRQLWKALGAHAGIPLEKKWANLDNLSLTKLLQVLRQDSYSIHGKSTYKQEFVTCGGVNLDEINFKTMESRVCKNLYFAGEVLDIDGVTGGFNFQSAWTTSWLAGQAMAEEGE
ncbi:MAG: aminoacetone oxidase family FAD-binding enzyme [Parachlamydia sp.]|nr:MAG: aminoacetone oxidase family FAD-binding enzyme [Parachlamydia sp.]